jgi:hypothetical protein
MIPLYVFVWLVGPYPHDGGGTSVFRLTASHVVPPSRTSKVKQGQVSAAREQRSVDKV